MANAIASGLNPIVNTSVRIRKADGKYVASVSKGCALPGIPTGTALMFSCVKCRARGVTMNKGAGVSMGLTRSDRLLRRIIMINCNIRHGDSLANTITSMGTTSTLGGAPANGMSSTLRKHVTNMSILSNSNGPARSGAVHMHNVGSVATRANPLIIVSNFVNNSLRSLGPSSVRSVRMLGSTSTATICNSHNTGNILLIAAGGPSGSGLAMSFGTFTGVGAMTGCTSGLSPCRCTGLIGRFNGRGFNCRSGRCCDTTRLRTFGGKATNFSCSERVFHATIARGCRLSVTNNNRGAAFLTSLHCRSSGNVVGRSSDRVCD